MNEHRTTVHARCPYAPVWDYYEVIFKTPCFLRCEDFQDACEVVRGKEVTQEFIFAMILDKLRVRGTLTVTGRHGQNSLLTITDATHDK